MQSTRRHEGVLSEDGVVYVFFGPLSWEHSQADLHIFSTTHLLNWIHSPLIHTPLVRSKGRTCAPKRSFAAPLMCRYASQFQNIIDVLYYVIWYSVEHLTVWYFWCMAHCTPCHSVSRLYISFLSFLGGEPPVNRLGSKRLSQTVTRLLIMEDSLGKKCLRFDKDLIFVGWPASWSHMMCHCQIAFVVMILPTPCTVPRMMSHLDI